MFDFIQLDHLMLLGIGILGGIASGWIFQKFKIPQVLGYLIIGFIIGQSGFNIINKETLRAFSDINLFVLGIIGFLVGGELKGKDLKKYGKQFTSILIWEGVAAFILVSVAVFFILFTVTKNFGVALAGGTVFGAIASATDPASTLDVLWEYRSAGILTTTIIAIVALDDALAMTLYGLGTGVATLAAGGEVHIGKELLQIAIELGGAVVSGLLFGVLLDFLLKKNDKKERSIIIVIGLLILNIALSKLLNMDVILATMTMGIFLTNRSPKISESVFSGVKSFSSPLYVLFFVMVGAKILIREMPLYIWFIVIAYIILRNAGKFFGTMVGASLSKAPPAVKRFAGMGLFAQGGVAIGLSVMAGKNFTHIMVTGNLSLSDVIVFGVTLTTFLAQIIGPPMTKLAARLSQEIGKDITKEDIIATLSAGDVMDADVGVTTLGTPLRKVFEIFSENEVSLLPVVNAENHVEGFFTIENLRKLFTNQDVWDWVLVNDIYEQAKNFIHTNTPLKEALHRMDLSGMDQILVVDEENHYKGLLDRKGITVYLNNELLDRKKATLGL